MPISGGMAVATGTGDEQLLAAVIAASSEAFVLADDHGRITEWNPAAERTFGYQRGEVLGLTLSETIVPPALRAAHDAGWQRFLRTGEPQIIGERLELRALHKLGHELPVELTITAVQVAGGRWRFAALLHDISDRLAAEAGLRRLAAIVTAADEGIVALTADGRIASWNPGATAVTGRSDADAIGQPFSTLFAPGGESQAGGLLRRALAGETVRIDTTFATPDAPVAVALNLTALPAPDGGATALFRDITDRKVAEERLAAFARRQRELAKRDDLTGLYNLRVLHEGLAGAIKRQTPLSVVRFDLRGLRPVNDRLGPAAGDGVLRAFGRLLDDQEGPSWAARITGGEFALVLPGADRLDARRAGTAIAAAFLPVGAGTTAAFGVAATSNGARTAEALLDAAERDLLTRCNQPT